MELYEHQIFEMSMQAGGPVSHRGIRLALLIGFGGVLVLIVIAGVDALRALRGVEVRNSAITQNYLSHHHDLERIRAALYLSGTVVRDYILERRPSEAGIRRENLRGLQKQMEEAAADYQRSLQPEERELFSELQAELTSYWRALEPVMHWTPDERRLHGFSFLESQVFPRRESVLQIASKIDAVNEQALNAGYRLTSALFDQFRRRLLGMLIISLGAGIVLAGISIARILRLQEESRLRYHQVERAQEELARLSTRLLDAQEEERRAIARELHDEIGQSMSALLLDIGNLAAVIPCTRDPEAARLLKIIRGLAEGSVSQVRNMALLLRPSMLDDLGLIPALHWQAREVSRRTGMQISVDAADSAEELPDAHKTCVYRIVQEALHNCARHADAHNARVSVRQEQGRFQVAVEDDGKGFDPKVVRGLGLLGMGERAKALGGRLQLQSQPGAGTRIALELPVGEPISRNSAMAV